MPGTSDRKAVRRQQKSLTVCKLVGLWELARRAETSKKINLHDHLHFHTPSGTLALGN